MDDHLSVRQQAEPVHWGLSRLKKLRNLTSSLWSTRVGRRASHGSTSPFIEPEPRHPFKLASIVGDLPEMRRGFRRKQQHLQSCRKLFIGLGRAAVFGVIFPMIETQAER